MTDQLAATPDVDELRMTLALERLGSTLGAQVADLKGTIGSQVAELRGQVVQSLTVQSAHSEQLTNHGDRIRIIEPVVPQVADHESRIRQLERRVWAVGGAAAVLGMGGGAGLWAAFGL